MNSDLAVASLSALAQSSRLAIFRLLVAVGPEGLAVGAIADALQIAPATLSFHLKTLTQAGLLLSRQEGRFIFYGANFAAMDDLLAFLTDNCCNGEACLPKTAASSTGKGKGRNAGQC